MLEMFVVLQLSFVFVFFVFSLGLSTPWTDGTAASVSNGNKKTNNSSSSPKWIGAWRKGSCLSGGRCQTRVLHESQKLARYQQHASDTGHTLEWSRAEWPGSKRWQKYSRTCQKTRDFDQSVALCSLPFYSFIWYLFNFQKLWIGRLCVY